MIELIPMTEVEFAQFTAIVNASYAQEKVESGAWRADEALRLAQEAHQKLLPAGIHTPDQHLFTITETSSDTKVGFLWFGVTRQESDPADQMAYVYQFLIYAPYRRRHYGSDAFRALEALVRRLGIGTVALHVFGANVAARALYEKLGYLITDVNMAKKV